ncbi:hypothetical protein pb186bvf_012439 [Paramecium bursaria]
MRRSIYFQQMDELFLQSLIDYMRNFRQCRLQTIKEKFKLDNVYKLMILLEKQNLIQILNFLPTKCKVSIDSSADTNSQHINDLIKVIKLNSRRIISLRKDVKNVKHYEINLEELSQLTNKSIVDLTILIENLNNIFISPEFHDHILGNTYLKASQEITKIKQNQIQDLDVFYCIGQSLKSTSIHKCDKFYSNQKRFFSLVDRYFNSDQRISLGELFNYNHQKYLPQREIEGLKERGQIMSDLRKLNCQNKREQLMELSKLYPMIQIEQLSQLELPIVDG